MTLGAMITIHSYKGGTGKTCVAISLAETFAMNGKKVCLADLDFRAPNVGFAFNIEKAELWINDYLNGNCKIDDALFDLTQKYGNNGQLLIAPANSSTEAIREMSAKDRKWHMRALGKLLALRNLLLYEQDLDYLIFDAGSGIDYSSINAVVGAELELLVVTMDKAQIEGSKRMVAELYDLFDKKTGLLLNKVPIGKRSVTEVEAQVTVEFGNLYNLPVLGVIPYFSELFETGVSSSFLKENPTHLFTKILEEIAVRVDSFSSGSLIARKDSELMKVYKERFLKKVTGVRM